MRPLDPRLLRYARRAAPYIGALAALGLVTAGLVIAQAQLLAAAIAGAFTRHAALTTATLAALAAVVAVRALAAWASEAVSHHASAAAKSQLRRGLLAAALRRPGEHEAAGLAELASSGVEALDGYFTGYLPRLMLAVAVPAAVLARIAAADPVSGVVVALTLPLVPVFGALIGMTAGRQASRRWQALGTLAHHYLDVVTGLPTLKVFGRAQAQKQSIEKVTGEYRRATMATLRLAFTSSLALELIATMSVALVATETGLRLAYGHLGLGTGLLVLILAPEAYLPLRAAGAQFHATADGLAAAREAFAILEAPSASPPLRSMWQRTPSRGVDASSSAFGPVTVEALTVRHPDRAEPAPDGLSLTVMPGTITALAGPSGCGKSTLINVLLGFAEPSSGRVTVTGPRGTLPCTPEVIRNGSAWLPQDPVLFAGTVADSIRLGWPDAPGTAVEAAARKAALDDVPLDRRLGERGSGLSAGQRRRVALARALLPATSLLLLDEPTAGLDADREATVIAALRRRAAAGTAVVVVTHRTALIDAADTAVCLAASAGPAPEPGPLAEALA